MELAKENIEVAENYLRKLLPEAEADKSLARIFYLDARLIGQAYASLGLEDDARRMFRLALELNGEEIDSAAENLVIRYLNRPLRQPEASYFGHY